MRNRIETDKETSSEELELSELENGLKTSLNNIKDKKIAKISYYLSLMGEHQSQPSIVYQQIPACNSGE